jgi:hypothetical protein
MNRLKTFENDCFDYQKHFKNMKKLSFHMITMATNETVKRSTNQTDATRSQEL